MVFKLRPLVPCLLLASLTACTTVGTTDGVVGAETRKGGFLGLSAKDAVEVRYAKGFAQVNKVVIGGFKVGFNDSKELERKRETMAYSTVTRGLVKLEGIDHATRQRVTDEMYEHLITLLQARGYQIVPRETFTGSPAYQGVKEFDFPYQEDNSGLFSSYGTGYFYSPAQIGPKQAFFTDERPDPGAFAGFDSMGISNAAFKFAEISDARVLNVSYIVDFAGAAGSDGFFSSTAMRVGQRMTVDSGILGISKGETGITTAQTGQLTLGQPVHSDQEFATIEDVTSEVEAGATMALNAATGYLRGGLFGAMSKSQNQTREYIFHATSDKYADAARAVLTQANTLMVDKMAELRSGG